MTHLLKNCDGHLVKTRGGYNTAPGVQPLARQADCHDCDPPIPSILEVTLSGLGGTFSDFNGINFVQYMTQGFCGYMNTYPPVTRMLEVFWEIVDERWVVKMTVAPDRWGCHQLWAGPGTTCDPTGIYTIYECVSDGCADTDSCDESVGATCEVAAAECPTTTTPGG